MHFGSVSAFPRYGRVAQLSTGEVLARRMGYHAIRCIRPSRDRQVRVGVDLMPDFIPPNAGSVPVLQDRSARKTRRLRLKLSGRALACRARGREFESRQPLQGITSGDKALKSCRTHGT